MRAAKTVWRVNCCLLALLVGDIDHIKENMLLGIVAKYYRPYNVIVIIIINNVAANLAALRLK